MAVHGKVITNAFTRQSIRFIKTSSDTNGQLLEMESVYLAHSKEPAPHYHPRQEEDFLILEGELTVFIHGELRILKKGEALHIAAGTHHAMWNSSSMNTVINWQVRPAMNTEQLLETITGLAGDGKTNQQGMPGILQIAVTAKHFANVFRLSKPPFAVQKILFGLISPMAHLFGYRATYKRYID